MNVFELAATLSLDSSGFLTGLKLAKDGLVKIGSVVGDAAKESVKFGAEFDHAMSDVAALSGATGEDFDALRAKAMELGNSTKYTATQVAEAMHYTALAGWEAEDTLDGIAGIMNLSAASGENYARVSDILTDAITAFGDSAADSQRYADVLAVTMSSTNTTVGMLGNSFKYIAPVAASVGLSLEDVSIALGTLANNGIKSSQAGTTLRTLFTNLYSGSGQAGTAIEALGINLLNEDGTTRNFMETIGELKRAFGELSISPEELNASLADLDAQLESGQITTEEYDEAIESLTQKTLGYADANKLSYAYQLAGKTGMSGLLALLGTADSDYEKLSEQIYHASDSIGDFNGKAQEMAHTMEDNLQGDLTLFDSALGTTKILISDQLSPALREFVQFGTESLSRLNEAFQTGGIEGLTEEIKNIFTRSEEFITTKLPEFIEIGGKLISSFAEGIVSTLPALTEAASQIIVSIATYIANHLSEIAETGGQIIESISGSIINLVGGLAKAGAKIVSSLFNSIKEGFAKKIPNLTDDATKIVTKLQESVRKDAPRMIEGAKELIIKLGKGLIDNIPNVLSDAATIIEELVKTLIELAPELLTAAAEIVVALAEGIFDNLPEILYQAAQIIEVLVKGIIEYGAKLLETAVQLIDILLQGIANCAKNLYNSGAQIIQNIKDGLSQKIQDAKNWGRDLITNFIGGITEKFNALKNTVSNIASSVKSFLGFSEPEKGPLSDFHTYAPDMMDLFIKGINDSKGKLQSAVADAFDFQPMIVGSNSNLSGTMGHGVSENVTINVYPSQGQSEEEIAEYVNRQIVNRYNRRKAVWA